MAKKIIKVGFDIDRSSAKEISDILKEVQSSFGKEISESLQNELDNILTSMERVNSEIKKVGDGDIPKGMFDTLNKEVTTLASSADKLIDKITREIEIDVDTSEFDKKIKESEKKIEQLRKLTEEGSHLGTVGGRKDESRKVFGEQVGSKYPGFDGTPESLGVSSIRKDLVHVKSYAKAIENVLNLEKELMATKNRTSAQDAKLKSIENDKEKLKYLQEAIELTNKIVYDRTEAHQKNLKQQEEEIDSLKAVQEERRKAIDFGSNSGKDGLGSLKRRAENTIHNQGESKSSAAIKVAETKSKVVESEALKELDKVGTTGLDQLVGKLFSLHTAYRLVQKAISETLSTISELDAAFVSIAVVTQYTNKEVWGMYDTFSKIAKGSGFTVAEVAGVAGQYFRQGESLSNVLMLTEAAAKAAKVAGIDAAESVRYLTSAVRGYNLAASDAMIVSDKFAAVAASTATDYDGLATAMSKVAAQAYANGVEMDNLMGMMATAMDVTQEAPENIGTAFKTILARMSEIKDYGKVLEDGVNANSVEKALKTVNVALFDQNKEMRGLDTVLMEVGSQWHTLNKSQKAYLATTLAGTRQQTRLLAVLENYDKTLDNIETSRNSAGATDAQQAKNTESIAHNLNRINVAFEGIVKSIANSSAVIGIVKLLATATEGIAWFLDSAPGKVMLLVTSLIALNRVLGMIKSAEKFKAIMSALTGASKKAKMLDGDFLSLFEHLTKGEGVFKNLGSALKMVTTNAKAGNGALGTIWTILKKLTSTGGLAVAAIAAIGIGLYQVANRAKNLKKDIEKLKIEGYNLRESKKSLETLRDEYVALDKKVIKTTKDMERMLEIGKLFEDLDTEGKYGFTGKDGLVYLTKVNLALKDNEEELKKNAIEMAKKNSNMVKYYRSLETNIEKYEAAEGLVIATQFDFDMDAWNKTSDKVKEMMTQLQMELIEQGRYINAEGEFTEAMYTYVDRYAPDLDGNMQFVGTDMVKNEEAIIDQKAVRNVIEYREAMVEAETTVAQYQKALERMTGSMYKYYESADPMLSSFAEFGELSNTTIEQIRQLSDAMDTAEKFGIEMTKDNKEHLIKAFDKGGPEGFSNALGHLALQSDETAGSMAKLALSLVDVFDEMDQGALLDSMTAFDSIPDRIDKLNDSLNNLNTESIREMIALVEEYPMHAEAMMLSIEETGQISDSVAQQMLASNTERIKQEIKNEIEQNKVRMAILQSEIEIAEAMMEDGLQMELLAADTKKDISDLEFEAILGNVNSMGDAYNKEFSNIVAMANEAGIKVAEGLDGNAQDTSVLRGTEAKKFTDSEKSARMDAIRKSLSEGVKNSKAQIQNLANVNQVLELAYANVGTAAWNAGNKKEKAGKQAKEAAANIDIYTGALNKLYVAQKKLEMVDWGIGLIEAKKNAADVAQAVQGIPGAKVGDAGTNTATGSEDLYAAYELRKQQLKELISVNKEYIEMHEGKLNPALKGAYKIINGQVIPVSSKYKNLTGEQMKELDEFAKSVNELGSSMNDYTKELYAAQEAQNKLIAEMRDAVIEYQDLLIDAIKNEEKKYLESFKKIIDGNKKFLEERKKLYEQAFADEDKEESQSDIEKQRLELIEKLAALEAAHDITSIQKKEEYRKQLADLDEQYNNLLIERNREAYLQSIDDQIQYQDELYQNEEEAYNARIESGEWLEQRLKEIQDEARLQAIMDNMLHSMTIQQMLDAGYITQEEITRAGITDMNTTVDKLSEEQLGIFTDYWGKNRNVIDQMWNGAEGKVGAKKLSEDAMDNILTYLKTHSTQMEGKTELMKDKVISQWKAMMQKVDEYTKDFNAITLKAPNYSNVTSSLNTMLDKVNTATKGILKDYQKVINKANETAAAIDKANSKALNPAKTSSPSPSGGSKGYTGQVITNSHGVFRGTTTKTASQVYQDWLKLNQSGKNPNNFAPMKTGGVTERTGLHWLDGTPGKPERVLSPGANKEFENLLSALTIESQQGSTDAEVVETLNALAQVIQYSSQENASAIINGLASGRGLSSIGSIAKELGISTNKKG